MAKKSKKALGAAMAGVMAVGAVAGAANTVVTQVQADVASDVKAAHAKLEHLRTSLHNNYLGLKNQATWEIYAKEAQALINKLPNGSTKTTYQERLDRANAMILAAASVNHAEFSIQKNFPKADNANQWKAYAEKAMANVEKVEKGQEYSDRTPILVDRVVKVNAFADVVLKLEDAREAKDVKAMEALKEEAADLMTYFRDEMNYKDLMAYDLVKVIDQRIEEAGGLVEEDTEAPVLKVDGATEITVENGAELKLPVVTATDNKDEAVEVTSVIKDAAGNELKSIDTTVAGVYTVTYSAEDAAGNKAKDIVVTVTVKEAKLAVKSVSAIDAKTLEVKFNKEISAEEKAKLTFEVKNGDSVVLSKVDSISGNSAKIVRTSGTAFEKGNYTVTVNGLAEGANAVVTTTVEEQKASKLEIKTSVLTDETAKSKIELTLQDQYGTDLALAQNDFTVTAYNKTQAKSVTVNFDATDKYFYVATNTGDKTFDKDDVISVTFIEKATGLKATKDLTVGQAAYVDAISFGDIELPKGKTLLTSDLKDVKVSYVAKDQYGNAIDLKDENVTVISSDENILASSDVTLNVKEDKVTKLKIASFKKEGKVTLTLLSKASGNTATVTLDVQEAPGAVSNVTVTESNKTIAAGSTGYVSLEVTDKYGNKVEPKDYLNKFNVTSSNPTVVNNTDGALIENVAGENYGKLKVSVLGTAKKDTTTTITITDKATGKQYATLTVKAGEATAPTVIGIQSDSKHSTKLANGANTTIKFEAKDQYGSKLTNDADDHKIVFSVKNNSDNITLAGAVGGKVTVTDERDASVVVNGVKDGSAILVAQLVKTVDGVDTVVDAKEITFEVVKNDSSLEFKIADIPVLYADSSDYKEKVKVETVGGVSLPSSSIISVTSSNPVVKVSGNSTDGWTVEGVKANLVDGKDTTAKITVVYNADDKVITLEKEVTVSAANLKADSILAVNKEQNAGSGIIDKLVDNTQEVSTINVNNSEALDSYNGAFVVVKDNFNRYVNATTTADKHNTVMITMTNKKGFTDESSANDTISIGANGELKFENFGDNVIATGSDKASFRLIITGSGKVKTIDVNISGKSDSQKADEAIAASVNALATPVVAEDGANLGELPTTDTANGTTISWSSSAEGKLTNEGAYGSGGSAEGETVVLTATISKAGGTEKTVKFKVTINDTKITGISKATE